MLITFCQYYHSYCKYRPSSCVNVQISKPIQLLHYRRVATQKGWSWFQIGLIALAKNPGFEKLNQTRWHCHSYLAQFHLRRDIETTFPVSV